MLFSYLHFTPVAHVKHILVFRLINAPLVFHFIYKETEEAPADTSEPEDGSQAVEVETGLFIIYMFMIMCSKGNDVLLMTSPRRNIK